MMNGLMMVSTNNNKTKHNLMPLLLDTDNDSDDTVRDDDDTVWDNGSAIVHQHGHDGKSIIMQSSLRYFILALFLP